MNKLYSAFVVLLAIIILSGCAGAHYGNEKQYENGDWYLLANSAEVARIKQDKLALKKLEASPVLISAVDGQNGYEGQVTNRSKTKAYTFKVYGPEKKSWSLEPGVKVNDFLIPGTYSYVIECQGKIKAAGPLPVTAQTHYYFGETVHWGLGWDE